MNTSPRFPIIIFLVTLCPTTYKSVPFWIPVLFESLVALFPNFKRRLFYWFSSLFSPQFSSYFANNCELMTKYYLITTDRMARLYVNLLSCRESVCCDFRDGIKQHPCPISSLRKTTKKRKRGGGRGEERIEICWLFSFSLLMEADAHRYTTLSLLGNFRSVFILSCWNWGDDLPPVLFCFLMAVKCGWLIACGAREGEREYDTWFGLRYVKWEG